MLNIASLIISAVIALIGIYLKPESIWVQSALATLTILFMAFSIAVTIQSSRDAAFTKRALENLIKAYTPPQIYADAISQKVVAFATRRGMTWCLKLNRTKGPDGYVIQFIFSNDSYSTASGVFEVDHEILAEWSLLSGKQLDSAIEQAMFGDTGSRDWGALCDLIGDTALALYPDAKRNGMYGVSAQVDARRIGVPVPAAYEVNAASQADVTMMKLGGENVPFLHFGPDELARLEEGSRIGATAKIATWLGQRWGRPTVFDAPPGPLS